MSSFDKGKANNLLQKYKSDKGVSSDELCDYLTTIKTALKSNSELLRDNDFIQFIYSIISISYTKKDFEKAKKIILSCVSIAEMAKQSGNGKDFYIQCLLKCVNNWSNLGSSMCEEILEYAFTESVYWEIIDAITDCIKKARKWQAFDMLYRCCKAIDSNKKTNVGGKSNYKIGADFLYRLENEGYQMPLVNFNLRKLLFISKFESKCNKETAS